MKKHLTDVKRQSDETNVFTPSPNNYKLICFLAIVGLFSGCISKSDVEVSLKRKSKDTAIVSTSNVTVSNIQIINHQIVITGTNLNEVNGFKIKEGSSNFSLDIESQSATSLVANSISNVTFAAGKVFEFVFATAEASSSFTVNFSLCDATLGGKGFNCSAVPNDKEVLSYDASSGKWKPRAVNGILYKGSWDANDPTPVATNSGDYYIVSVAQGIYNVGDWLVYNGSGYDRVDNSQSITDVFGRTGAINAEEGDYDLDKMADVDLTTNAPVLNNILKFNGTHWVPAALSPGNSGTVTTVTASAPLSITNNTTTPAISITQATTSTNGFVTSTDWNTFNNKQAAITAGTTAQYYRGDKSWQTLNTASVAESTNLYFTNARALGVALTGFSANNSAITATDTVLSALGKAQGQLTSLSSGGANYLVKNGSDTISGQVSVGSTGLLLLSYTPVGATDASNKAYVDSTSALKVNKTGDTMSGDLTLDTQAKFKSGTFYTTVKGSNSAATNYVLTLPTTAGSSNQVLTTNGSGVLSWTTPATTGTPSGAASGDLAGTYPGPTLKSGVITDAHIATTLSQSKITNLTTDLAAKESTVTAGTTAQYYRGDKSWQTLNSTAVTEGTNLYFTNARALGVALTGFSENNSAITATDTVLTALGKAQGQITNLSTSNANYLVKNGTDAISGQVTVGSTGILLLTYTPVGATDAVNKAYVDSSVTSQVSKAGDTMSGDLILDTQAKLKSGTFYTTLKGSSSATANYVLTLPVDAGANNQVLTTNGSGVLSWTTVSGGGGTPTGTAGGDLAGTYPNPTLNNGVITDAHIATTLSQNKITGLTVDLAAKEPTLTAGTTAQYYRGDKSWQTLNSTAVTEGTNLYFTNARSLAVPLTGFAATNSAIVATDTVLAAFGKAQGQISNFTTATEPALTAGTTSQYYRGDKSWQNLTATSTSNTPAGNIAATNVQSALNELDTEKQGIIDRTTTQAVSKLRIYGANTTNYVELTTGTLTGNRSLIFPDSNGSSGYVLSTDGAGVLSWVAIPSAAVTSVAGRTGAITLSTSDVSEGTNLYYTTARALGTQITAPTLTNSAIATSDTIQVALGKLQAQIGGVLSTVLTSLSTATNSAITAADTILSGFGKLQAQATSLSSAKLDKTGGTLSVGTISGVPTPTSSDQIANKAYVDSVVSGSVLTCPTGYVLVPGNATYSPKSFCVAKYEMKNDGYGTAVPSATGLPWVSIDRPTARTACQALGPGYDMISNDQWQNIARNIAGVASNWSTGTVTSGELNRGHSDNSPANSIAAVTDDNDPCNGTGQTCDASTWDSQRRTHVLSNGNKIWDFSGNVWEWVTNNNTVVNGADAYMGAVSTGDIRQTRYGAAAFCAAPSATPWCGMGYGWFNFAVGAVIRGGPWNNTYQSGIFATSLGGASTLSNTVTGFRCVFIP